MSLFSAARQGDGRRRGVARRRRRAAVRLRRRRRARRRVVAGVRRVPRVPLRRRGLAARLRLGISRRRHDCGLEDLVLRPREFYRLKNSHRRRGAQRFFHMSRLQTSGERSVSSGVAPRGAGGGGPELGIARYSLATLQNSSPGRPGMFPGCS